MESPAGKATPSLLACEAFEGRVSRAERITFVGQAVFNGCIATCGWPRPAVERLLPPELTLAPNRSDISGLHPVVFVFGDQTRGAIRFGGFTVPTGIEYQEFALAIPFVRRASSGLLYTYLPRMYSSYLPATLSGNLHYGFAKRMAEMGSEGPIWVLRDLEDGLVFHARVEIDEREPAPVDLPNFAGMRGAFSLPILGKRQGVGLVTSYFDWGFDRARVRLADAVMSVDSPFVTGLERGTYAGVDRGCFDVRGMLWRLSWPERALA